MEKARGRIIKPGWSGKADVTGGLTKNTRSILQLSSGFNVQYHKEPHWLLFFGNLSLLQVTDNGSRQPLLNRGQVHVRYNYDVTQWVVPEVFVQAQYNQIQKIQSRYLFGAGPRARILKNDTMHLFVGALYMFEREEEADVDTVHADHRLSTYVSFSYLWKNYVTLDFTVYYQPRFDDFSDYRISMRSSLSFALSSFLSFITRFSLNFDDRPPVGIERADMPYYSWTNGFVFKF